MATEEREPGKITVAVTGPTGSVGAAFVRALDREPTVAKVLGMARRPFDPVELGLRKLEYRRGDIQDRAAVNDLVAEADVVVHLAFIIWGSPEETRKVNLSGSRNVFEATFEKGAARLIYTSSVAAYGFETEHRDLLTEEDAARGSDSHYYSRQKADLEDMLLNLSRAHPKTDVYVFRPCIVAGPTALELIEKIPLVKTGARIPQSIRKVVGKLPLLRPVLPDPGIPFQLVHEDDVAQALVLGTLGRGTPGTYNLAAEGEMSISDLARALGWYSIPLPDIALDATARIVSRLPLMPAETAWVDALRVPVLVSTDKARKELGWEPVNDAFDTLSQTVHAARQNGLLTEKLS